MSDVDDAKEALLDDLQEGVSRKQIGDRSYDKFPLRDRYEILKQIEADSGNSGSPFLKVRLEP